MARSRLPLRVVAEGARSSSFIWAFSSQFPVQAPRRSLSFASSIAAATDGSSRPLSASSRTSFRTAKSRRLMVKRKVHTRAEPHDFPWKVR